MQTPECQCFKESAAEMENRVYAVAHASLTAFDATRVMYMICDDAFDYAALTLVTMLLRTMAGRRAGDMLHCEAEYEAQLAALVDDVRMRDSVLNALLERARDGRTNQ